MNDLVSCVLYTKACRTLTFALARLSCSWCECTCDTGTESDEGERSGWIEMSHFNSEQIWQRTAGSCS